MYPSGNFTCLDVVFVLKRSLGYYLIHTYIPTCLIVIISVICLFTLVVMLFYRYILSISSIFSPVDFILVETRGDISSHYTRCNGIAYAVDAARKIASVVTARLLFENCRCVHVNEYNIRVHGSDGNVFG